MTKSQLAAAVAFVGFTAGTIYADRAMRDYTIKPSGMSKPVKSHKRPRWFIG
jgi:hypothetical protein